MGFDLVSDIFNSDFFNEEIKKEYIRKDFSCENTTKEEIKENLEALKELNFDNEISLKLIKNIEDLLEKL